MKLTKKQIEFLDNVCYIPGRQISSRIWSINSNGEVDVDGNVSIPNYFICGGKIPVKFGEVTGYFDCTQNNLKTLKNIPNFIGGSFYCHNNNLTDYFKNIKEEDFPYGYIVEWYYILKEYPFLINIGIKYLDVLTFKHYLNIFPQTKLYYRD